MKQHMTDREFDNRADEIDGSVWDACLGAIAENSDLNESLASAVSALLPPGTKRNEPVDGLIPEFIDAVNDAISEHGLELDDEGLPEWDMAIIGDVTEVIENWMYGKHLPVCHPWIEDEDDEAYCPSVEDRCKYCPYA